MRRVVVPIVGALLALTGLTAVTLPGTAGAAPPPLTSTLVANITAPTALAFLPDGVLLATNQAGKLYVVRNGTPNQVLDLGPRICTNSERGLLGVAVDPQFATNRFIYLYFTQRSTNAADPCPGGSVNPATAPMPMNHVARFVLNADDTVSGETTVINQLPSYNGNHNGGDVNVGPDGKLYVSVGDGGCDLRGGGCAGTNNAARDVDVAIGKILRVNTDGTIPSDNPFVGQSSTPCGDDGFADPGKHCPETWAWGFRNPFRMAFGPTGKLYANDVGQGAWEEVDDILKGADYGWNIREGHCSNPALDPNCNAPAPAGLTAPIHDYDRSAGCTAITGAAFVPNRAPWPVDYQGDFLFADYGCGKIFRLQLQGGVFARDDLVTGLGARSAVHMEFGPDGALYFTSYAGGGAIHKIAVDTAPPVTTAPTTPPTTAPPAGTTYLSDLQPKAVTNAVGPMERDRHNGGAAAGDGGPIVLAGRTYRKGLGTNAFHEVTYDLARRYTTFVADVGIDDSCGSGGSATAEVHTESGAARTLGVFRGSSATQTLTVNVTNKTTLRLVTGTAGDGNTCDRVDWADARLTGTTPPASTTTTTRPPTSSTTTTTTRPPTSSTPPTTAPPTGATFLSTLTPASAKNGLGPVERDRHNGGSAAGDGGPIVVGGTGYARGLGVYPRSTLAYNLNKQYASFRAVFGIDDSCGNAGSVRIEVHRVTGTQDFAAASSGTLTGASAPFAVNVDVRNADKLILHVIDVASNGTCARSDWADARLLR